MSEISELSEQIDKADQRITNIIKKLEELTSLEESLQKTKTGLIDASAQVGLLAKQMGQLAEEYRNTLDKFSDIVERFKQADFQQLNKTVQNTDTKVNGIGNRTESLENKIDQLLKNNVSMAKILMVLVVISSFAMVSGIFLLYMSI